MDRNIKGLGIGSKAGSITAVPGQTYRVTGSTSQKIVACPNPPAANSFKIMKDLWIS